VLGGGIASLPEDRQISPALINEMALEACPACVVRFLADGVDNALVDENYATGTYFPDNILSIMAWPSAVCAQAKKQLLSKTTDQKTSWNEPFLVLCLKRVWANKAPGQPPNRAKRVKVFSEIRHS
jgi:hypothetical protein